MIGRVPFSAWLVGRLVRDPLPIAGWKPFQRLQLIYDLPFRRLALVNDPPTVETVMQDKAGQFPKSRAVYEVLRPLIGEGVFGQPGGDIVRESRRIIVRSLSKVRADRIAEVSRRLTVAYMERWLALPGGKVPIATEMSRLTIDIVSECMLGGRFSETDSRRFTDLFSLYHQRARPIVLMLAGDGAQVPARALREMRLDGIGREMRGLIRDRFLPDGVPKEELPPFQRDCIDSGLWAETDRERLLDEVAVMLLAGHETTASTLAWLAYELARLPVLQEQASAAICNEAGAEAPMGKYAPDAIVEAFYNETLRLYPPIGFFLRETRQAMDLLADTVAPGSYIAVAPRTLHRHHDRWKHPDDFMPSRWLERDVPPERTAFIPYGMGARVCPGARFATIELTEISRLVLTHLDLALTTLRPPRPHGSLTSRPEPEIVLKITQRRPLPKRPNQPEEIHS